MKIYTNITDFNPQKKVVLTTGTFDGLHIGHQKILKKVKQVSKLKNAESVVLTFSPHPRKIIFPDDNSLRLINSLDEKILRFEKSGIENLIIYPFTKEFSRISALEYVRDFLVKELKITTLIIGYDHQFGKNREGNFEYLKDICELYGFEIIEISAQDIKDVNISSTKIRKAIQEGNFKLANEYLGYNFPLTGIVVEGKKIGKTIGVPTANLFIEDENKIIPKNGVYAVHVFYNNTQYKGVMNIGNNPTVSSENKNSLEVYIFDFDKNIYGEHITIEFIERIREEQKFNSIEDLKSQINRDKKNALGLLS